jgi:hypothetical protein
MRALDLGFGQQPLSENPAVMEHFRQCAACSKELEDRERMRDRLKTAVRGVSAPPALQARIRSSIRESERMAASWGRYLLPVAAALLVSIGGVVSYELGHLRLTAKSQESYIGLVSSRVPGLMKVGLGDHVHCTVFRKFPKNPPALDEMTQKLGPEYEGLLPLVRDKVPADFKIVLAHRCGYHGRKFVHLALRNDSKLLSLVISLKSDGEAFPKENLLPALSESGIPMYESSVQRFEIAAFESRKHLVFVVSDLPGRKNMEILTALAPSVRDLLDKLS